MCVCVLASVLLGPCLCECVYAYVNVCVSATVCTCECCDCVCVCVCVCVVGVCSSVDCVRVHERVLQLRTVSRHQQIKYR